MIATKAAPMPLAGLLIAGFLVGVPIADLCNGFLVSGYDIGFFATAYKSMSVPLLMVALVLRPTAGRGLFIAGAIWAGLLCVLLIPSLFGDDRINAVDLTVLLRGPMLLGLVLALMSILRSSESSRVAAYYFRTTWWVITVSIPFLYVLGLSHATYGGSYSIGSKGAYIAGNELTIVYVLSWSFIVFLTDVGRSRAIAYSLATLAMMFVIGTKGGFVFVGIALLWRGLLRLGCSSVKATLLLGAVVCVAAFIAVDIFLYFGPLLGGWDRLAFFIDKYGPVTAMTGGRFVELPRILSVFSGFDLTELLFGMGFDRFWDAVATGSVESDPIDLFGGAGLVGLLMFYGVIVFCIGRILRHRVVAQWGGIFYAVVLYSIFVGHVAFAATPAISVAVLISALLEGRHYENRYRAVVVQQPQGA